MKRAKWVVSVVLGALMLLLGAEAPAQAAPEPPALAVLHASLSSGLDMSLGESAHAIKQLIDRRSSLTHVRSVGTRALVDLAEAQRALPAPARLLLAYALQGPGSEVAILVCGPAVDPE